MVFAFYVLQFICGYLIFVFAIIRHLTNSIMFHHGFLIKNLFVSIYHYYSTIFIIFTLFITHFIIKPFVQFFTMNATILFRQFFIQAHANFIIYFHANNFLIYLCAFIFFRLLVYSFF